MQFALLALGDAPLWSPDGGKVLFASDRTGASGIWAVGVADGKARGAPALVKANMGRFSPLGFSRQGSYYYGLDTATQDIYVADGGPGDRQGAGVA